MRPGGLRRSRVIGGGGFSPLDVPGLVAWYDAADTSTITHSGGAVSEWRDKSGNGYHLTQATGSQQPTTGTATINGRNVMRFVSNDFMQMASNATWMTSYTVAVIVQVDAAAENWWAGIDTCSLHLGHQNSTNVYVGHYGNDQGYTHTVTTTPKIHIASYTKPGSRWVTNGSLIGSSGTAPSADPNTGGKFQVGRGHSCGGGFLTGNLGEVVVCSPNIGTSDEAALTAYLNSKWAVF